MQHKLKEPCAACPWRRESVAGYLGGYEPEQFVNQIQWDGSPLPCHQTISEETVRQDPEMTRASMCYGALVFMKNSCKSPQHPGYGDALDSVARDTERVFQWPQQFLDHHKDPEGWLKTAKAKVKDA